MQISVSLIFMTLRLVASLPSLTPAYYNLFQYISLLSQTERLRSFFENIFLFPMTTPLYRLAHILEVPFAPFLHAKILRINSSQKISLHEGFLVAEIVLSFSFEPMLQ